MIFKGKVNTGFYNHHSFAKPGDHPPEILWVTLQIYVPKSIKVVLATINEVKTSKPFKLRALLSWLVHASR